MTLSRRTLLSAPVLLAGLSPMVAEARPTASQPLVLERVFRGRLRAEGRFTSRLGGATRTLVALMNGRWDGRVLTLAEDFTYSDGERDRVTWRFTKLGEGRYAGTREDVIGTADVRNDGAALKLSYDALVKTGFGRLRVHFEDVIVARPDGSLYNTAVVTFFGIPVGDVELVIRRIR
ncbi:DUF3833 domain-containing protein [Phreatobacter aquaticus]|uniref:DUF3833 domain-containing protein n=1 Tax=Phreatobacter aquaticus TaxID=2570229 RepID=A0A4D7QDC9_9HYPH|nr:DUF3833 family protein [Phreatobacter aquaticus]QCK85218.1 DUF3833 domain-containing protein [Phreatobacter aquaticus]